MITMVEVAERTRFRIKARDVICAVAGAAALALGVWAASTVAVPIDSDLGLVAVLPYQFWAGVVLLNLAFVVALRGDTAGPASRAVMIWLLAVLVLMLFGTAIFVTDIPRGEVAFRHLGIADALASTQDINPDIDAYFNWPGFFALLATLLKATGIEPVSFALWAPVVDMGLWLAALAVLLRQLTTNPRRRWLVLWLFCLGNWQDQDYLSPQAFGLFLYLVVLALVIGPLGARPPAFRGFKRAELAAWWRGRTPVETQPVRRLSALVVTLLLVVVISASHQLTPFMVLIAVTALTLSGRVWASRLPLIIAVVLALWLAYPASAYLDGHPPLADAGLQAATQANIVDRVIGTPGHLFVVQVRMLLTAVLWVLALAGAVWDWRRKRLDIRVVLLAVTPPLLFPTQSYGGEMLIRVSLFALPFIAMQASSVLLPARAGTRPPVLAAGALALCCCLLAVMTVTGRFGNARYDVFTDNEIAAVKAVQRLAPDGSAVISAAHPTPWRNEGYVDHRYRTVEDLCKSGLSVSVCGPLVYDYARHNPAGGVVLLTRSSEASLVLQGDITEQGFDDFEQWLRNQDTVQLVYSNADARVYRLAPFTQSAVTP